MGAGKRIAGDVFGALDAFEQEGIAGALRDAQIGADRRKQIRGKNVVHRNEISLLCEALKFAEVRSDHGELRPRSSARNAARTAPRMAFSAPPPFIHRPHPPTS